MGLAASQIRLLQLTRRGNEVRCQLTHLSMQKMRLTADRSKASRAYQEALSSKTLKWTNNSGASYMDLNYKNLMYPNGAYNNNKLFLITDINGKVVLDSNYRKYAEIISPNGHSGDWEAHRAEILPQLIGLSSTEIEAAETYNQLYLSKQLALEKLENNKPKVDEQCRKTNLKDFLKLAGTYNGWSNLGTEYNKDTEVSQDKIDGLLEHLKSLKKYLPGHEDTWEKTLDTLIGTIQKKQTMQEIIDQVVSAYDYSGGACIQSTYNDKLNIIWYDVDSTKYQEYLTKLDNWQNNVDTTRNEMNEALGSYNSIFTPETKSLAEFYDKLFSSVAERGWCCNEQVADSDYLSQMLLNGMYNITTIEREYDTSKSNYINSYDTEIATNCSNIIQVSDSTTRDDALVKYEAEKELIQAKETKIDTRMKNLETEQSAIKQMMESINNTMKNNIEQNMNIFA